MVTPTVGKTVYSKPVKTVRGVLDRAINLLESYGLAKGAEFTLELQTGNVGFCSNGVLNAAAGGRIPTEGGFEEGVVRIDTLEDFDRDLVNEALVLVAKEIDEDFEVDEDEGRWNTITATDVVIDFNDGSDTTTKDVLRVFKAARAKA